MGKNAYLIDLPSEVPTFPVFNVSDLFEYHGETPTTAVVEPLPFISDVEKTSEGVEEILDVYETGTCWDTHSRYLVHWQGCPMIDSNWISEIELCRLRENLYQNYQEAISMGLRFLPSGKN